MESRAPFADAALVAEFRGRLSAARTHLAHTRATPDEPLLGLAGQDAGRAMVGDVLAWLELQELRELAEVEAAQVRLDTGLFGVCEGCDRPISLTRLRAMPTARGCGRCPAQTEARG